jgi:hypothetical protein
VPLIVGDRPDHRPEIFMPYSDGHVFTQGQFNAAARGGGGREQREPRVVNLTLVYNARPGEQPASRETMSQMMRQLTRGLQKRNLS